VSACMRSVFLFSSMANCSYMEGGSSSSSSSDRFR
jgi:hypothetical protein